MKNLVKNNIRSWKNNKISIIGLSFLTFFGLGSYCVLSNTTANISNQYNKIAKEGNLHDMTISELYNIGNAHYQSNTQGIIYDTKDGSYQGVDSFWTDNLKVKTNELSNALPSEITSGVAYFPIPNQIKTDNTFVRSYHITLDYDSSTSLYQWFASQYRTQEEIKALRSVDLTIVEPYKAGSDAEKLQAQLTARPKVSGWSKEECSDIAAFNIFKQDYSTFNTLLNDQTNKILSYMTIDNTPLSIELQEHFSNDINFRSYKAANVVVASEFYKVVESDPSNTIDKLVLFKDTNNRTGNNLYTTNDFAPYNGKMEFVDEQGNTIPGGTEIKSQGTTLFYVPRNLSELMAIRPLEYSTVKLWDKPAAFIYSQIMQIRFKALLYGDMARDDSKMQSLIDLSTKIAANNITDKKEYYEKFTSDETIRNSYDSYISSWRDSYSETININNDGSITFTWNTPTPKTCKIVNWTTKFAVVNPQYLKQNKKTVIEPKYANDFEPYKLWFKAVYQKEPSDEIDAAAFNKWLNTLNTEQVNFWIQPDEKHSSMHYDVPGSSEGITIDKTKWSGVPENQKITLGGFSLIIWGCGLTPDFVYPVVDISRPTPNSKTEAIVYTNPISYNNIKHGYANAPVEKYVVATFKKQNLTSGEKQQIIDKINKYVTDNLSQYMLFPKGTKYAALADDVANTLNTSAIRVAAIPELINTIRLMTIILSSFIIILCVIICFIIIKRFVEANRVNIGIMRANGFSKKKIAFSLVPFSILPSVVGGVAAYLIGFALQVPALLLFKNYWTLPTSLVGFSALSFIRCIFIPFILFSLISIIATLVVLKSKAVDLMKSGSEFKTNAFSRVVKKPFKKFGIMTRFRVSLAFNSISRLLMLAAVSTLTMSTLVFAMTSYNRLAQSQSINSTQFNYKYSVDLTTPTSSGGTYSTIDLTKNAVGLTNVNDYWYNCNWDLSESGHSWIETTNYSSNLTKPYSANQISSLEILGLSDYRDTVDKHGTLMLPNASDAKGQAWDLLYLQNKLCSKLTLDYNIGIGSLSSNPWEIALSLMPANSRSLAADGHNKIVQNVGAAVDEATAIFEAEAAKDPEVKTDETKAKAAAEKAGKWFYLGDKGTLISDFYNKFNDFFTSTETESGKTYTLITDILTVGHLFMAFNIPFLTLIKTIYSDYGVFKDDYTIMYGAVEVDKDQATGLSDEKYTYVNANIKSLSTNPRIKLDSNNEIKIEGIKWKSDFIKLTDKNGESLNRYLFENTSDNSIPVVVNAFAAHKYNLKKGSTINIAATNTVDRFERQLHPEQFNDAKFNEATLKVQAISQGTNGEAFYISQYNANNLVGMPNGYSWNQTHRYMMYSEDLTEEWSKSTLPKVVDLSFDNSKQLESDKTNNVWSFNVDSTEPTSTTIPHINNQVPTGFNGIYTANPNGKPLTQVLSLYSCSGLYPGSAVYKSIDYMNNRMIDVLANGNNLALANFITGVKSQEAYEKCKWWLGLGNPSEEQIKEYRNWIDTHFLPKLVETYGDTTMVTAICGAMDISASDLVYKNLISTLNLTETCIMAIIIPITIIIVGIISNLIINDSKKMAAMLKALGYSDMKNIMSILSLFLPTIALGLILAIPLSFGLVTGYQAIIFSTANILVDVTQQWWYYAVAIGGIGVILLATYIVGYRSLKKDRLVDQIK